MSELLRVENLRTYFHTRAGLMRAVDGVDLDVSEGRTLGVVGESGCGKSVTALSIMRLIDPPGRVEDGSRILFGGRDLAQLDEEELRGIRGNQISSPLEWPPGCRFAARCDHAFDRCRHEDPPLLEAGLQWSACWLCENGPRSPAGVQAPA